MRQWARLSEAWCSYGVWRSLVARFVRDEEVAGSNPVTPTVERLVRYIFRFWTGAIELRVQQQSTAAVSAGCLQVAAAPRAWRPSWRLRKSPW
jgi:hypothetical protein